MRNSVPITVVGNLTGDPELRFTPSGQAVAKLTVAVNPRYLDKAAGEWKDGEPSFHRVTVWRELAENVAESLHRGDRVVVAGQLAERRWPDKDDSSKTRSAWEITAEAIGPDLTYARAKVQKMSRGSRGDVPPDDAWSTASRTPVPAGAGDEPPF